MEAVIAAPAAKVLYDKAKQVIFKHSKEETKESK
jgi:hypothetical protein